MWRLGGSPIRIPTPPLILRLGYSREWGTERPPPEAPSPEFVSTGSRIPIGFPWPTVLSMIPVLVAPIEAAGRVHVPPSGLYSGLLCWRYVSLIVAIVRSRGRRALRL